MGCCYSTIEREEIVSRCKARKRYMKQFVKARQSLSASHAMYIRSLRSTGSALLQFSNTETDLHHNHRRLPPTHPSLPSLPPTPLPPPPPPMSPSSDTWTTTTTATAASPLPPPPPPPPPVAASSWDFWDPFAPPPPRSMEEWDEVTTNTTTASEMVAVAPPSVVSGFSKETASGSGSELAMVVSKNSKDLVEIIKEVDEYFLKAADAGGQLSCVLEVSSPNLSAIQSKGGYGCHLTSPSYWTWGSSPKLNEFGKISEEMVVSHVGSGGVAHASHCSTVERLYAWEKRLFLEVKNAESLKIEHQKKLALLRKLEVKRAEYVKTEKTKKEIEKVESKMMVATQGTETTFTEIIKLRETELYPQLLELVKGSVFFVFQ
ncbi:hypothetical protein OIU77_003170 [Salix suchowensis]|uniref:Uncharacterized protein n=1 Tax=Salix suchowensis TaxID=1278906 RepID=A0ABQ9AZ06_9ROSI|nr:hypothetical protein OIU77_003170 [Salix suchowensis]